MPLPTRVLRPRLHFQVLQASHVLCFLWQVSRALHEEAIIAPLRPRLGFLNNFSTHSFGL